MAVSDISRFKYLARHSDRRYFAIVCLVFLVGVVISLANWYVVRQRTYNNATAKYNLELNESKSFITGSLDQYSLLLDEGASLLSVYGNNINQTQWLSFFKSQNLIDSYPGIAGVNFAQYVPAQQLSSYLSAMAAQGEPSLVITPAGTRSAYAPLTYIGYVSPVSLQALGLDQLSNPVRKVAILQALDSGTVSMSGRITSIAFDKGQPAFIMYKPVYNGLSSTEAQRQSSILGFVYAGIESDTFFGALLSKYASQGVAVQVYDGKVTSSNLLYESPSFATRLKHITNPVSSVVNVAYGGQTWRIRVTISQALIQTGSDPASNDLLAGVIISLVAAGVLWYFTYYRYRNLYWQRQMEVQAAKNELLSLASHQLRTPATIVKQYLGVLLQNYSGSITKQQRDIIQIAYDSNEHQLRIANQFLDAARVESGRLTLAPKDLVLNDVLQDVIDEQRKIAKNRRQKIVFKNPKRRYKIKGDPKYLPMVFENLISNAVKYSKRGTGISVTLYTSDASIYVSVKDQGMGVPEREQADIFEKFTRASTKENVGKNGTGIGLYLAKEIVNLHDGDITVESTVGKGSRFTVVLPVSTYKETAHE